MRDFLRFFLSATDQARVDAASIAVSDSGAAHALQVSFRITNPAAGAPQIRPLFPGAMTFIAAAGASGVTPEPSTISLAPEAVATWKTNGTLIVKIVAQQAIKGLAEHGPSLEVQPNVVWYSPVRLTDAFLLTTIPTGLAKADVSEVGSKIKPSNANWSKHAVARFLQGTYTPELRIAAAAAADDDVAKHAMPTVEMTAAGQVTLTITVARAQPPQDGDIKDLNAPAGMDASDPAHPVNGRIPTRHVLRVLQPHLIDGAAGTDLSDAVLEPWPKAPRFFSIAVTRTWQLIPNASVLFPSRKLRVRVDGAAAQEVAIPAHGIVYLRQAPAAPAPNPPQVSVEGITGAPSSFISGHPADVWKQQAPSTPIAIDFGQPSPTRHVILRLPMKEEIFADKDFPNPGGMRCTYMSLRRATRAFVDHRVTGGRLVREKRTLKATRDLMDAALTAGTARLIVNNLPAPSASPGKARDLEKVWQRFFPDIVPAQTIDGSTHRTVEFDGGQMFYNLWQTIESVLRANGTKRNFADDHVGTGAPGAMVAIGLSAAFLVRPPHTGVNAAVLDQNVADLLARLTPGCLIQFWDRHQDYALVRTRSATAVSSYGHSPIFREFMPLVGSTPGGIVVVDQFGGSSKCPLTTGNRLKWGGGDGEEIWVAAQWNE